MSYPRRFASVHQIEIASSCNLKCKYCPSRVMHKPKNEGGFGRPKKFMERATFERALEWAQHFEREGTQGELAITGIGESLLHPEFADFIRIAREALPGNLITFSTNGILVTEDLCQQIAPYNPRAYVSLHRPERAKHAVDLFRRYGLLDGTNTAFATESFNWAGGLDWEVSIPEDSVVCEYLRSGWGVVLADGRFSACCLDASGASSRGTVWDEIGTVDTAPWGDAATGQSCSDCHMRVPLEEELRHV
jgi:hypothetical protein